MTETQTFEPKTITVKAGDAVVWKNVSNMSHGVTDVSSLAASPADAAVPPNGKEFDSGLIAPGKEYSHTFTVPGTYKYFCIPHEALGMLGTVTVKITAAYFPSAYSPVRYRPHLGEFMCCHGKRMDICPFDFNAEDHG